MRVLQITASSLGGIGRLSRDISDILIKQGDESLITYGRGAVLDPERDFMFGCKWEVYIHALWARLDDAVGLHSNRGTKELLAFIADFQPDLVQLHNLHGYYINYELLFRYLHENNIPVVWTLHDCWSFTGHCSYFDFLGCRKWEKHCQKCELMNSYPKAYVDRSFRNFCRKKRAFTTIDKMVLVTPSEWLAGLVEKSFLRQYPIKIINNGIDLQIFRVKGDSALADKKIVLGLASTWNERKGFNDFIRLSELLPDSYQIVMVGVSRQLAKRLPSSITPIEHTETVEELVDWYNKAFVFVNPTYEDNFPTTNLEAMACGTSVITYRTGGSPESLTQETGYVLAKGDVEGIAAVILNHVKTPQTIKSCRKCAMQYDKHVAFAKYVELYKEMLQQ